MAMVEIDKESAPGLSITSSEAVEMAKKNSSHQNSEDATSRETSRISESNKGSYTNAVHGGSETRSEGPSFEYEYNKSQVSDVD
jgi:hypothetical protein